MLRSRSAALLAALPVLALGPATLSTAIVESPEPTSEVASASTTTEELAAAPHIVRLVDPPLATYRGGIAGLSATTPRTTGETRLDVSSPASRAYLAHLRTEQDAFLTAATLALGERPEVEHRYSHALNGVAVHVTQAQAERLRGLPGVAEVEAPFAREVQTDAGPEWIGAPGLWDGTAGPGGAASMGEGVVIGVIDTGINHDHPSFADVGGDGHDHDNPRDTFYGLCDPLTGAPLCNDKLIGVWDLTGTGPNDEHGHGSHTASTSGGNVVDAVVKAPTIALERPVSGVAPHANLIAYKACTPAGTCLSPSLVAAIDQATADGVDVINYSIGGGSSDPWGDADALAFLAAREAGVFVATSAGNEGPGAETIGSPADAPWVLGVGAASHDRAIINSVAGLSGGASTPPGELVGRSMTAGYGPAALADARAFGDAQCLQPFLPGTFDGQIVVCERGVNPRVEKGTNVQLGGAGGMILVNTEADGESTVADPHVLPAVHLGYTDGARLAAWMRDGGDGHTGSITGTVVTNEASLGDITAGFSSRGPNLSVPGVIKPDVIAPGVDILAAVHTVDPTAGPEFGLMSGTSMSSPHAAGAAALVRALQPEWTPAEVQSALMVTGLDKVVRKDDGTTQADPFDEGAGRVDLTRAARAGMVLDVPGADYLAADPAQGGDPSTLNLPSLGEDECRGTCSWTRLVRNPGDTAVTWRATTEGDVGLTVSPRRFTVQPGEQVAVKVTADVSGRSVGTWTFGAVRFTAAGSTTVPEAHFPVAVRPAGAGGDSIDIEAGAATGSHTETVTSPIDVRSLQVTVAGLQQGVRETVLVPQDPTMLDPYDTTVGTHTTLVEVPAGSRVIAADIGRTTANDLDLFVGIDSNGDGVAQAGEELCSSATAGPIEGCTVADPEGGTYWVMVQNWLSGQVADEADLTIAVVPGADAGNLTASGPGKVAADTPFDLRFDWALPSLESGDVWVGAVDLGSSRQSPDDVGSVLVTLHRP
ncbi:S8 family serine peptidase [Ornithinimicrobium cavernae]|uniref:S8 family serine peptidase n=1 Tax=Ornithinimicrobium cavernae TaxID=2666047 RepID=UPI00137B4DE6|nr:S8 family serine peptidase [Ornithinimicrobium cavernae]